MRFYLLCKLNLYKKTKTKKGKLQLCVRVSELQRIW